jgi:hypothetical protein
MKPAGTGNVTALQLPNSNESRTGRNGVVVDGSMGFDEPMIDTDNHNGRFGNNSKGGLYSDNLVPTQPAAASRRGRGAFRSGRNGR